MSTGWSKIKYKQDLPPPGGYKPFAYKRNLLPTRISGAALLGGVFAVWFAGIKLSTIRNHILKFTAEEDEQAIYSLHPLLIAEEDRKFLRWTKEKVESEALNIVGTGYDPEYLPGNMEMLNDKNQWKNPHTLCDVHTPSYGDNRLQDVMLYYYNHFENLQCGP